jgi:hypothetical protein
MLFKEDSRQKNKFVIILTLELFHLLVETMLDNIFTENEPIMESVCTTIWVIRIMVL